MKAPLSVIVYGPQACGKTRNAERLRKGFGLDRVIDDWDGRSEAPERGALVLTNNERAALYFPESQRYAFEAAMRAVEP